MIGKLKGIVDSFGEDFVILDVQGVGYVVHCSARTLQRLPAAGEATSLSIETFVREDMIRLYGFGRMRSGNGFACSRPFRASARRWLSACFRCWSRPRSRTPSPWAIRVPLPARPASAPVSQPGSWPS